MHLIAVGRLRAGPEFDLLERYVGRLRPRLTVTEIAEATGDAGSMKRREGEALLAALPRDVFVVALDLGGQAAGSEAFARQLEAWQALGRKPAFLIGGAEGLSAAVLQRADHVLSLGPFTWPHMLVRVLLAEQLYRAQCIAGGHPYHRAGRPG
jgi:23S rRNA (pseudouridine1915-N3)-methyltransferase